MEVQVRAFQEVFVEAFEGLSGFAAVEADGVKVWIGLEQGSEIIALLVLYGGVEAASALAGADGVQRAM